MTRDDVAERILAIQEIATTGDDEKAHGLEDDLWSDVLQAIATGRCREPRECAQLALTTSKIKFARWCA